MAATAQKKIPGFRNSWTMLSRMRSLGFLKFLEEAQNEYGDLFELKFGSQKMVLALHPDHVRHINVTQRERYDKGSSYDPARRYLMGQGLIMSTGDLWKRQRKLMAPFYTPRGIEVYYDLIAQGAELLSARWLKKIENGDSQIFVLGEMSYVTAQFILKALLSIEVDEEIEKITKSVETMIAYTATLRRQFIALPLWMPSPLNKRYLAARNLVHSLVSNIINARRQMPESEWPKDLLTMLMQARDDAGEGMSDDLIYDEVITVFIAGYETTARILTYACYLLATNRDELVKLREELNFVMLGSVPTIEELHEMPYTLGVIKETLRLYPSAPIYVRDVREADEIDGYSIAPGTTVMLCPYFTHRHKDFWDEPLAFMPERWEAELKHPYAFHPFAAGERVCIGNNLALLEAQVILAALVQKFDFHLPEDYMPQWDLSGTLDLLNPMYMSLSLRR